MVNSFNIMAGVVAVICVLNSDKIDKNVRFSHTNILVSYKKDGWAAGGCGNNRKKKQKKKKQRPRQHINLRREFNAAASAYYVHVDRKHEHNETDVEFHYTTEMKERL